MGNEGKTEFKVKDLIVTALLAVCALAIYMVCAILSFSPYTMLAVSPLWALLAGITYFLVAARTKKSWALFVFCALTGVHGLYVPMIVCCLIAGVIAATLASKTSCTNERALTASYVVYMVLAAFGGMYVPFLFFSQQTLTQYSTQFGEDYMQLLSTIVSPAMAVAMLLVVALCAFLGSLIARKLLKKHFQKAGLV